jgi:threonine dehydratase
MTRFPTHEEITQAAERIKPHIHRTPVYTCAGIDRLLKASLFFKCENLQKTGAFKFRGATNAVLSLTDTEAEQGVATHSSGNHAAALALAAQQRGIKAYIVMPRTAAEIKKQAVASYGAYITYCEPTLRAREKTLEKVIKKTKAIFIHPYNDLRIITGQATAARELFEDIKSLDYVIAPVGGGGLLSGTALSASFFSPDTRVIGAEPAGADDAYRSIKSGKIIPSINPKTIADGLLTSLGTCTFPIIQKLVDRIMTVNDDKIIEAMRIIWERMKLIVEPSAAVPLAVLLKEKTFAAGKRIGIILSGGNLDLCNLPWK